MTTFGKGHVIAVKFFDDDDLYEEGLDNEGDPKEKQELVVCISENTEYTFLGVRTNGRTRNFSVKEDIVEVRTYNPEEDFSGLSTLQKKLVAGIINKKIPAHIKNKLIECEVLKIIEKGEDSEEFTAREHRDFLFGSFELIKDFLDL